MKNKFNRVLGFRKSFFLSVCRVFWAAFGVTLMFSCSGLTVVKKGAVAKEEKTLDLPVPQAAPKDLSKFRWYNDTPEDVVGVEHLVHAHFYSEKNQASPGYYIYLPEGYSKPENRFQRYPVIYHLHGGRPGAEFKGIRRFHEMREAMLAGKLPKTIIVFPNGGKLSHYDHQGSFGEQAFLELVEHVDLTYRTIGNRSGRLLQGGSQGGRGVTRYIFKFPHLFSSAIATASGHQWEYAISQNNGRESEFLTIDDPNNNTWDLAKAYASDPSLPKIKLMIVIGDEDKNYKSNVAYYQMTQKLGIDSQLVVAKNAGHGLSFKLPELENSIFGFHREVLEFVKY